MLTTSRPECWHKKKHKIISKDLITLALRTKGGSEQNETQKSFLNKKLHSFFNLDILYWFFECLLMIAKGGVMRLFIDENLSAKLIPKQCGINFALDFWQNVSIYNSTISWIHTQRTIMCTQESFHAYPCLGFLKNIWHFMSYMAWFLAWGFLYYRHWGKGDLVIWYKMGFYNCNLRVFGMLEALICVYKVCLLRRSL